METMTPKERIDAVIKHQAVDRTPFTVVDGGAWIAKTEGVTYRELYMLEPGFKLRRIPIDESRPFILVFCHERLPLICVIAHESFPGIRIAAEPLSPLSTPLSNKFVDVHALQHTRYIRTSRCTDCILNIALRNGCSPSRNGNTEDKSVSAHSIGAGQSNTYCS